MWQSPPPPQPLLSGGPRWEGLAFNVPPSKYLSRRRRNSGPGDGPRGTPRPPTRSPNMPYNLLGIFSDVDPVLCQNLDGLEPSEPRAVGLRRPRSPCPVARPGCESDDGWARWGPAGGLPPSPPGRVPFRVGVLAEDEAAPSSRVYKTELCRTFEESGVCKYGAKCQFAHGPDELRGLKRHPKYKTEPCRTFHSVGFCPYGGRCHFVHNGEESLRPPPTPRHGLGSAGFASVDRSRSLFARDFSPTLSSQSGLLRPPAATEPVGETDSSDSVFRSLGVGPPVKPAALLRRRSSAESLSEEGYASSCSLSSGCCESAGRDGRRLPIFSRLSVTDE
ncbi:mRNA decay activator protein ZFP36L1-like [Syngnathoides biaculeatus]|uniref:mRNA decay activator protein ZFP36L1-like n=1 Tax=Syngnathoides biaculeatus TaxID=300417 RepID=UPI002ADE77FF|nr:mRNA decay activator protein ZFP36L1-like [Syngnathoides biaculeatus]